MSSLADQEVYQDHDLNRDLSIKEIKLRIRPQENWVPFPCGCLNHRSQQLLAPAIHALIADHLIYLSWDPIIELSPI